jgi:hypothetical protein
MILQVITLIELAKTKGIVIPEDADQDVIEMIRTVNAMAKNPSRVKEIIQQVSEANE